MAEAKGAEDPIHFNLRGMSDPMGWLRLWSTLRTLKPDVIVGVNQTPLIVAVVLRLLGATRARVISVFHTTYLLEKEMRRFFLYKWTLRLADAIVFVSATQKRVWQEQGLSARRMEVIPNGVDLAGFRPDPVARERVRAELGFREDALVLALVAAFRPEKNHEQLLHAARSLLDRGVPVRILFVGDGPTRPAIETLATTLGVRSSVTFAGSQSDVRPWIAASDLGVLCSHAETFPLSALEFIAMGVPMIMPAVGGTSEIVQDRINGLLFEPGSNESLTQAILSLADPKERARYAEAAVQSALQFSVETMADTYRYLLEGLMDRTDSLLPAEVSRAL
jgi:glycosyltransferase involved in cell wall biosynthesis